MMGFLLGAGCAAAACVVLFLLAPLLWLLTGGDLAGRHWLLHGEGSLASRWRWREWNGRNPNREGR